VYLRSGSSAFLAEALHSAIDTFNQALLFFGLRESRLKANTKFQFGYGRAAFTWSLVSAQGMFWAGGAFNVLHGIQSYLEPQRCLEVSAEMWAVLGASFGIDGSVLLFALMQLSQRARLANAEAFEGPAATALTRARAMLQHLRESTDPFLTAVLLEDLTACAGVVLAGAGIALSNVTGLVAFDAGASVAIGSVLAGVSLYLTRLNMRYLLGPSLPAATSEDVTAIIRAFPSIDRVSSVRTQWLSPTQFSVSATVDFDGTYLAARLHSEYEDLFHSSQNLQDDLPLILSFFAEDCTRLVEQEVRAIEAAVRMKHPGAAVIELEPASSDADRFVGRSVRHPASASAEAAEVFANRLAVLAAMRKSRPDGMSDSQIQAQEDRVNAWYMRVVSLRGSGAGSAQGAAAATLASIGEHDPAPEGLPQPLEADDPADDQQRRRVT
jgi:zinc transporter 9